MKEAIDMGKDPKALKKALKQIEEENAWGYKEYEKILWAKSISYGLTDKAATLLVEDMRKELQEKDLLSFKPLFPVKN